MKTQNPLIGRSRKSYGDATFYTLNGENIVRTKPMMVTNPNTPAQQAQRIRFRAFTEAANSMSEASLNLLFNTKVVGRNRRSMLQAQIAPAYGTKTAEDPTATEKFEPTFDIEKLGDIGSGPVGYIGDFVELATTAQGLTLTSANFETLTGNMIGQEETDELLLVVISEDGCMLTTVDAGTTISGIDEYLEEHQTLSIPLAGIASHGDKAYCYAIGGKLQLIGLGTFSVAERAARKGHNQKHNVPV